MKAAFFKAHGGPEVLQIGELPTPSPDWGEVLVRVRSASLNHLDLWVRQGLPGLKIAFPHIPGCDAAGVVEEVGPGVTAFKKGDAVVVHPGLSCGSCEACGSGWESLCPEYRILGEHLSGAFAEWVKVPARNLFAKPDALSFDQAAAVPLVFTTAWQMLVRRAKVQAGEKVVIHAAGSGVGSAGVQIAKLLGATVIATAGSEEKLEQAKKLGADHAVLYTQEDWFRQIRKLAPEGCDVIFDHLGKDFWAGNIRAIRNGGRIVLCGATTGAQAVTDLNHVFYRQIQVLGSTMGSKADFPRILSLLGQGKLHPVVDKAFALSDAASAFERLSGRRQFGKLLVNP